MGQANKRIIKSESLPLADEVELQMNIDCYGSEECDTEITIDGSFYVEGVKRQEFTEKLRSLINEYLI